MHYVALSRVRNIDSLHVLHLSENKIKVNLKVSEEMQRLRTDKRLELCLQPLDSLTDILAVKILFQNVRSLHLHFAKVLSDFNVQAADLDIFVETALCSHDNGIDYFLDGFEFFRNDIDPQICTQTVSSITFGRCLLKTLHN